MSGGVVIRVEGHRRLVRTMRDAGVDVGELKAANKTVAEYVARAARPLTPVGPEAGGHVKNSIRTGATNKAGIIRAGNKRLPYAGRLHYGWRDVRQTGQPWVLQAAQSTESAWVGMYQARLDRIIDQIKGD